MYVCENAVLQVRWVGWAKRDGHRKHLSFRIISSFFVTKKIPYVVTRDVCPSSVEISLERGSKRSAEPIDLKIGLNMDN